MTLVPFFSQKAIVPSYQDPFYDSSCSELSDIPEVEEPSSPESANENSPLKDTLHSLVNGLNNLSNDSSDIEEIYLRNLTEVRMVELRLWRGFGTPPYPYKLFVQGMIG